MIRYCDDLVCCFQNQYDAQVFKQRLEERFGKYGLELAEEKTKIYEEPDAEKPHVRIL